MLRNPVSFNLSSLPSTDLEVGILEVLALELELLLLLQVVVIVLDRWPRVGDKGASSADSDMLAVRDSTSVGMTSRDESTLFLLNDL